MTALRPPGMPDLASMSDGQLLEQLTRWSARVAAGEARLLVLLGEVDAREAYAEVGALSCAHWASWRLGWSPGTARDRVRVARCLRSLPATAAALAQGALSYAQVRALCRVAAADTEHEWLELARWTTAAQLEKVVRGVARAVRDPHPAEELRDRLTTTWLEDGSLRISATISPASAPAVLARIEAAQKAVQAENDAAWRAAGESVAAAPGAPPSDVGATEAVSAEAPAPVAAEVRGPVSAEARARVAARAEGPVSAEAQQHLPPRRASLADGLVRAITRPESLPPTTVTLLVDPVSGWARTAKDEVLPPTTLAQARRALPGRRRGKGQRAWGDPVHPVDGVAVRSLTPADLRRKDKGRQSRQVPDALRRLLGQVDGERCRFPSCDRITHLQAHHVTYWSLGGRTDLANLVLVCSRHHTLIHSQGFQLSLAADRTLTVRTSSGALLTHHAPLPQAAPEELTQVLEEQSADPSAYACEWAGDRFDLGYVVAVMAQHAA